MEHPSRDFFTYSLSIWLNLQSTQIQAPGYFCEEFS